MQLISNVKQLPDVFVPYFISYERLSTFSSGFIFETRVPFKRISYVRVVTRMIFIGM